MEINNFSVRNKRIRRWIEIKKEHYSISFPSNEFSPISFPSNETSPISFPDNKYNTILFPGREQRRERSHNIL